MAPSAIATEIKDPVSISSKTLTGLGNRDVSTTLNYIKRPGPEGFKPIDRKIPLSERRSEWGSISDTRNVVIKDIRGREKDFKWDVEGFQYLQHEINGVTDWADPKQIQEIIQPATEELVKKVTGASETVVYFRRTRNKPNVEGQPMSTAQSPTHVVHTDMTRSSHRHILKMALSDDEEVDRLLKRRFVCLNVWRPIKQIFRDPLAVCNWKTVDPAVDIYSRVISEGSSEFGLPMFNEKHEWFYLNGQRCDEPLLFMQLDSNMDTNITILHSAFVDPKYKAYPARESIEIKMFAFFDQE